MPRAPLSSGTAAGGSGAVTESPGSGGSWVAWQVDTEEGVSGVLLGLQENEGNMLHDREWWLLVTVRSCSPVEMSELEIAGRGSEVVGNGL